jgi:putative ABC transport system substrate-binding protein
MTRVAVLWNPDYSQFTADWRELRGAAERLGVKVVSIEYRHPEEFQSAFEAARRDQADAVTEFSDLVSYANADRVALDAATSKVPSMFTFREAPDAGALASYGPSIPAMWRRAADFVVRILKGDKPG